MKASNKLEDVSAEIALNRELRAVKFESVETYFHKMVAITSKYEVKTETDLIKYLVEKISDATYAAMIISHLSKSPNTHNFEKICNKIKAIQRVTKGAKDAV